MSRVLLIVAATVSVSACSIGLGEKEFGCSAIPGTKCQSATQVYARGNDMQSVSNVTPHPYEPRDRWPAAPWTNTPTIDSPEPIREAPRVMRIWVHPYEDSKGDLHMPGFIFTEIEPRRWAITDFATNRRDGIAGSAYPSDTRPVAVSGGGTPPPTAAPAGPPKQ